MFNPCYEYCFLKYEKQYSRDCDDKCDYGKAIAENKLLKEVRDYPIHTLYEMASRFCVLAGCENCSVHIYNYEKRTPYEKEALHEPCCSNLYKWFIEEAQSFILNETSKSKENNK